MPLFIEVACANQIGAAGVGASNALVWASRFDESGDGTVLLRGDYRETIATR